MENIKKLLLELSKYLKKELEINKLPKVKLINNDIINSENILGKTAYYDPQSREVVLYTYNRHPNDILSSFCHEMIHHKQNEENRLNNINTQNILEDDNLENLEKEAYQMGGITYRKYKDFLRKNK
jgi:hypothetical protein